MTKAENNIHCIKPEDCSGCSACSKVCPCGAISMQRDSQGFLYPKVDPEKCTSCGLCLKVCPSGEEICNVPQKVYATKHKNVNEQLSSTSGGFSAALAENVIERGGVAYGVVLTDDFKVITSRAEIKEELQAFKGSKYVQTNNLNTFAEIADDLKNHKPCVFFGSSCHVNGLLNFLHVRRIDCSRLVTVDFLCHGVPSPLIFEEYIRFVSRKIGRVKTYYFRTKTEGWGSGSSKFSPAVIYRRRILGKCYRKACNTPLAKLWLAFFFSNNCLRPHCYRCPYCGKGRPADITMADFWGLKKAHPDFFDENGVSLVITNTDKGLEALNEIKNLETIESTIEKAGEKQNNMFYPSSKSKAYGLFWSDYHEKGFDYVVSHYTYYNFIGLMKIYIKRLLGR